MKYRNLADFHFKYSCFASDSFNWTDQDDVKLMKEIRRLTKDTNAFCTINTFIMLDLSGLAWHKVRPVKLCAINSSISFITLGKKINRLM
jgi:hypothetical protein